MEATLVNIVDANTAGRSVLVNADGSINATFAGAMPPTATSITASSGNQANANAVATLAANSGQTTYITGFDITGTGATTALPVTVTVAGVVTGTMSYTYAAVAGALLANQTLSIRFQYPVPASATNTAIVVTCPALGSGNTHNTTVAYGYQF